MIGLYEREGWYSNVNSKLLLYCSSVLEKKRLNENKSFPLLPTLNTIIRKRVLRQLALFFLSYYSKDENSTVPFRCFASFHYGRMTKEIPPTAKFILFCYPAIYHLVCEQRKECPKSPLPLSYSHW